MSGIHTEQTFEAEIEAHPLAHGYESASSNDFDRDKALFPQLIIEFVQATQPKVWDNSRPPSRTSSTPCSSKRSARSWTSGTR